MLNYTKLYIIIEMTYNNVQCSYKYLLFTIICVQHLLTGTENFNKCYIVLILNQTCANMIFNQVQFPSNHIE